MVKRRNRKASVKGGDIMDVIRDDDYNVVINGVVINDEIFNKI